MKNEILIINYNLVRLKKCYFEKLKEAYRDILDICELLNLSESCDICDFNMGLSMKKYFEKYNFEDNKLIIVFGDVYLIPIIACAATCKCRIMILMWNPIEEYDAKRIWLIKEFVKAWLFDKGDVQKYGLYFSKQFYFIPLDITLTTLNKKIIFVCEDKNRMKTILKRSIELTKMVYVSDSLFLSDYDKKCKLLNKSFY